MLVAVSSRDMYGLHHYYPEPRAYYADFSATEIFLQVLEASQDREIRKPLTWIASMLQIDTNVKFMAPELVRMMIKDCEGAITFCSNCCISKLQICC